MSVVIMAMIGLACASMLVGIADGVAAKTDLRALAAREKLLHERIHGAIANSKKILASGSNYLVIWIGDTRADSQPNISELQRLELNAATGEFTSYKGTFPANFTADQKTAADTGYSLAGDFNSVTIALKAGSYFPGTRWATQVAAWTNTLDNASPQLAHLVSYQLTLSAGSLTEIAIGAASLRNSR